MLLALVLRLAAPQGWMPNVSGGGTGSFIVICSVHGQMTVQLDANGHPAPAKPGEKSDKGSSHPPCAFGGLGGALPAPLQIALPTLAGSAPVSFHTAAVALARGDGPTEARGPPSA